MRHFLLVRRCCTLYISGWDWCMTPSLSDVFWLPINTYTHTHKNKRMKKNIPGVATFRRPLFQVTTEEKTLIVVAGPRLFCPCSCWPVFGSSVQLTTYWILQPMCCSQVLFPSPTPTNAELIGIGRVRKCFLGTSIKWIIFPNCHKEDVWLCDLSQPTRISRLFHFVE